MVELEGESLKIIVTTRISGDIVNQICSDAIDLTVLIKAGQDPHSYEASARDLPTIDKSPCRFCK